MRCASAAVLAAVWACCALALYALETQKRPLYHRTGSHSLRVARSNTRLASPPPATPVVAWWQNCAIVAQGGRLVLHDGARTEELPPPPNENVTALYTQGHTLFIGHAHGVHTLDMRSRRWGPSVSVHNVTALAAVPDTPLIAMAGHAPGRCSPVCSWDVHGGNLHPLGDLRAGSVAALSANDTHLWATGTLHIHKKTHHVGVYTRGRWQTVADQALPCAPHAISAYGPLVATQCPDTLLFHYNGSFARVPVPEQTHLTHLFAYAGEDEPVVLAAGALPHANGTAPFAQLHQGAWHALATYVGPPKVRPVLGIGSVVGVSLALGLGTTFALVVLSVAATLLFQVLRLAPQTPGQSR